MTGPCLCGDPFCPHCGSPGAAEIEAAEEWATDQFAAAKFYAEEYTIAVKAGLLAVELVREAVNKAVQQERNVAAMESGD